mmetsp:Transcript_40947/g.103143  ORF Transcript_40947/g.103143 Transcript_40947/m.103143 type:complete len:253 (-) Transcript_40947:1056-1814(-)
MSSASLWPRTLPTTEWRFASGDVWCPSTGTTRTDPSPSPWITGSHASTVRRLDSLLSVRLPPKTTTTSPSLLLLPWIPSPSLLRLWIRSRRSLRRLQRRRPSLLWCLRPAVVEVTVVVLLRHPPQTLRFRVLLCPLQQLVCRCSLPVTSLGWRTWLRSPQRWCQRQFSARWLWWHPSISSFSIRHRHRVRPAPRLLLLRLRPRPRRTNMSSRSISTTSPSVRIQSMNLVKLFLSKTCGGVVVVARNVTTVSP